MLGLVKEIAGQKTIVPLTADTGAGAPVGSFIYMYKKSSPSGYLYCDGSTFDQTKYPALYQYLGSNVLPDYRECVAVGAEQNTTDTIASHDVYTEGEFKDDQLQIITGSFSPWAYKSALVPDGAFQQTGTSEFSYGAPQTSDGSKITFNSGNVTRSGTTTHGKQKAVYVYIKATSGLAENQQENVLNAINENNSYSTTEHTTGGKWIDGKPIYRKVVEVSSLPNNTQTSYSHGIANVDTFVTIRGIAKSAALLSLPIPFTERNGSTNIQLYAQPTSFDIATNYDASAYAGTFIFEYTKTTD